MFVTVIVIVFVFVITVAIDILNDIVITIRYVRHRDCHRDRIRYRL